MLNEVENLKELNESINKFQDGDTVYVKDLCEIFTLQDGIWLQFIEEEL